MAAKVVTLFCIQTFIQCISAQCIGAGFPLGGALLATPLAGAPLAGAPYGTALGYGALGACPWEASALAASHGPGLAVTSASPVPPVGLSVASENAIEGALAIGGATPFLGAIGLEGAVPTAGAGAVSYSCGNGEVGILAEDVAAAPVEIAVAPLGFAAAPLAAPLGYASSVGFGALGAPYGGCGTII